MTMKKTIFTFFALLATFNLFAQDDPAAKKLLDEVSKKYDGYQTIQSDFTFAVQQAQGAPYTDKGVLYLNKAKNQYRIQMTSQDFISDGKSTWSVLKEDKEVQITSATDNTNSIGPNNIFSFYKTGFKSVFMGNESERGTALKVVELSPLDTKVNYFKIKLRINKNNHIHDVLIFDKSGGRYTYTIKTLYINQSIAPFRFTFNTKEYSNYELVDLR